MIAPQSTGANNLQLFANSAGKCLHPGITWKLFRFRMTWYSNEINKGAMAGTSFAYLEGDYE
jgi:hypothetical protein